MLFFLIDSFVLKSLCPSLLTSPPKLLFEFVFFQNMHFSGHLAEIAINPLQVYAVSSQDSQAMKLSIIGLTHSPFDHDVYWNCQWIPRQCIICFQNQSKVIHIQFFALSIAQIHGNWPNWTKIHKKSNLDLWLILGKKIQFFKCFAIH